jgi:hypothetical protein
VIAAIAPDWTSAWSAALDELELDVARAVALLFGDHAVRDAGTSVILTAVPWRPPANLPPLPEALAQRARTILERQVATSALLATAAHATRRHLAMTDRMHGGTEARPVFVDSAV